MREIVLAKGYKALVDDGDYELVNQHKWSYHYLGYAQTNGPVRLMHRLVMSAPKGKQVDHINGNRLDNRKTNLRICSHGENRRNGYKHSHNTSGYKGVTANRTSSWRAQITFQNKVHYIGCFKDPKDAARAYNEKAKELFGAFANLNKGV